MIDLQPISGQIWDADTEVPTIKSGLNLRETTRTLKLCTINSMSSPQSPDLGWDAITYGKEKALHNEIIVLLDLIVKRHSCSFEMRYEYTFLKR